MTEFTKWWQIPLVLVAFILIACSDNPPDSGEREPQSRAVDPRIIEAFGGPEGIAVLKSPARVEIYRVDASTGSKHCKRAWKAKPGNRKVVGYPVVAGPVQPTAITLKKLQNWFVQTGSYRFGDRSNCAFCPGYVLRFVGEHASVDVLVCFDCKDLLIRRASQERWCNFRPGSDELLEILSEVKFATD